VKGPTKLKTVFELCSNYCCWCTCHHSFVVISLSAIAEFVVPTYSFLDFYYFLAEKMWLE